MQIKQHCSCKIRWLLSRSISSLLALTRFRIITADFDSVGSPSTHDSIDNGFLYLYIAALSRSRFLLRSLLPLHSQLTTLSAMHRLSNDTVFSFIILFLVCCTVAARKSCPQGSFLDGSSCKLCPKGTYGDERNSTSCKPCPAAFFGEVQGLLGIDACRPCPPGTFSRKQGASSMKECKPCPKGTSSCPGCRTCLRCGPGKYIRATRETTFSEKKFDRDSVCESCPGDYSISKKANSLECEYCENGQAVINGKTACRWCSPGSGPSEYGCGPCYGQFSDGNHTCNTCPAGFVPNRPKRADKCVPCPPGTTKRADAIPIVVETCDTCTNGGNLNATGAPFCLPPDTPCPEKYFVNFQGACQTCKNGEIYVAKEKKCVLCGKNMESNGSLSTKCTRCPKGKVGSLIGCICGPGQESLGGGKCYTCPSGTYLFNSIISSEKPSCDSCRLLEFSKPGSTKCSLCPPGKLPNKDRSECEVCPKGTRISPAYRTAENKQDEEGARCVDLRSNCPPGEERVVDEAGTLLFCHPTSCPKDKLEVLVKDDFGSSSKKFVKRKCVSCKPGQYISKRDGYCYQCNNGTSKGGKAVKCKKCRDGFTHSEREGKCKCLSTPNDYRTRGLINGKCQKCLPGTFGIIPFGRLEVSGCMPCPAGQFENTRGSFVCSICPEGWFTDKEGSRACKKCPPGTTSFGVGDSKCVVIGSLKKKKK